MHVGIQSSSLRCTHFHTRWMVYSSKGGIKCTPQKTNEVVHFGIQSSPLKCPHFLTWWMLQPYTGFSLDIQLRQREAYSVRLGKQRWRSILGSDPILQGVHASLHSGWFNYVRASPFTFNFVKRRHVMYASENKWGDLLWDLVLFYEAHMLPYIVDGSTMYELLSWRSISSEACDVRLGEQMEWSILEFGPLLQSPHASLHGGWFNYVWGFSFDVQLLQREACDVVSDNK